MARRGILGMALIALAAVGAVAIWQGPRLLGSDPSEREAAQAYASAWAQGRLSQVRWTSDTPDPAAQVATVSAGLTPAEQDRPTAVSVAAVRRTGDAAEADLDVSWALQDGQQWGYRSRLPMRLVEDSWQVPYAPMLVHPDLAPGQVLRTRPAAAPRAPVLGRDGQALVRDRPVVQVGLEPRRTRNAAGTVRRVAALLDVQQAPLLKRLRTAAPDAFIEVITLRRAAYDAVRERLRPLPGVVLREGTRPLAPTADFARALLGSVGPVTAEMVAKSEGRVQPGDVVGLSGLQAQFQDQLAGRRGVTVEAQAPGGAARQLFAAPPVPGAPLRLTLDEAAQRAADEALAQAGKPAALVALKASTGELLAVANGGPGATGYDRALLGSYPPGSTFKIASAYALLQQGVTPDAVVPCPRTTTVSGKQFTNAEGHELGRVPFSVDFAQSCNTAFVDSAPLVTPQQLSAAAGQLGYATYDLHTPSVGGKVPAADDEVAHAAAMIGQGQVLASPLAVAVSAASVAAGQLHPPRLLADAPPAATEPLPAEPVRALRRLMREVVTGGTGKSLRAVPGGPVAGKTGTAEYGTRVPPRTHAWFAGYRGDVAFAVLVEDGGFGAEAAAPLAAAFLRGLPS